MSVLALLEELLAEYKPETIVKSLRFVTQCGKNLKDSRVCYNCGEGLLGLEVTLREQENQERKAAGQRKSGEYHLVVVEYLNDAPDAYIHSQPHLERFVYNADRTKVWVCASCKFNRESRGRLTPQYPDGYGMKLVKTSFPWLHTCSIVDVHFSLRQEVVGYATGAYGTRCLLDAPLMVIDRNGLGWEDNTHAQNAQDIMKVIRTRSNLYSVSEPLLAKMHVLGEAAWARIVQKDISRDRRGVEAAGTFVNAALLTNPFCRYKKHPHVGTVNGADVDCDSELVMNVGDNVVNAEHALFPAFFPGGEGFFEKVKRGQGSAMTLLQYWQYRYRMLFSVYTIHPAYIMLLHNAVSSVSVASALRKVCVPRMAYKRARDANPEESVRETLKSIARENVPVSEFHSSKYFARELNNLLHLTHHLGRAPDFFWTATADEGSKLRNIEYHNISVFMDNWCKGSWRDAPCECSRTFIAKTELILKNFIFGGVKVFGEVEDYAVKYECQSRGSLHVHVVMWLKNENDRKKVAAGIMSYMPCELNEDGKPLPPSRDTLPRLLYDIFEGKQIHVCRTEPGGCRADGKDCMMHYPNPIHTSVIPKERTDGVRRLQYACFRKECDLYVVATHFILTILFRSHTNMQVCINEQWCAYLLKYTMKPMISGFLEPKDSSLDKILKDSVMDEYTRKVAVAHAQITPVSCNDLALAATETPFVRLSRRVSYVECKSPQNRSCQLREDGQQHNLSVTTMQQYEGRPKRVYKGIDIPKLSFAEYHRQFVSISKSRLTARYKDKFSVDKFVIARDTPVQQVTEDMCPIEHCKELFVSLDEKCCIVFKRSNRELVRFSVVDPEHNLEEWCFTLLCQRVVFTKEDELMDGGSYVNACVRKFGILDTHEKLQDNLENFHRYRFRSGFMSDGSVECVAERLSAYRAPTYIPYNIDDVDMDRAEGLRADVSSRINENVALDPKQRQVFNHLQTATGIYILDGGPGTGKSTVTKLFVLSCVQKGVIVSASTASAAALLSRKYATTVHKNYVKTGRPRKGYVQGSPVTAQEQCIGCCRVHIVDEYSMLEAEVFKTMLMRITNAQKRESQEEMLKHNLILLVGDHCQLPVVCSCKHAKPEGICRVHSIATTLEFRSAYETGQFIELITCHRNSRWAHVLHHIRTAHNLTQDYIDREINHVLKTAEDLPACLRGFTAICSNRKEVAIWNEKLLNAHHAGDEIENVYPKVMQVDTDPSTGRQTGAVNLPFQTMSATEQAHVLSGSDRRKKYSLNAVAVGARVRVTLNVDPKKGYVNAADGIVLAYRKDLDGVVTEIDVQLSEGGVIKCRAGNKMWGTFRSRTCNWSVLPLTLNYAMTIHTVQGASISTELIIDIVEAFDYGLGYTAISRSTDVEKMYLVRPLKVWDLRVANLKTFYQQLDDLRRDHAEGDEPL